MTNKLYLTDSYLNEIQAVVVRSSAREVILDRTIFYPGGGGQPSDTGRMIAGADAFRVVEVRKEGEEVVHLADHGTIAAGSVVKCQLDWGRRYAFMRYHSAIHLLDAVFMDLFKSEGLSSGSQIYEDRARVDFSAESISRSQIETLFDRANSLLKEDRIIRSYDLLQEEALEDGTLARTKPGKELIQKLKVVRIVEIEGLDRQADGGTHVSRTSEIGTLSFQKLESKGRNNKRVYFSIT